MFPLFSKIVSTTTSFSLRNILRFFHNFFFTKHHSFLVCILQLKRVDFRFFSWISPPPPGPTTLINEKKIGMGSLGGNWFVKNLKSKISCVKLPLMLRLVSLRLVVLLFLLCTLSDRFYDFRFSTLPSLQLQLQCTIYLSSSFSCCTNITTFISICNKLVIPHPIASPATIHSPICQFILAQDRNNIILYGVTCRFLFE